MSGEEETPRAPLQVKKGIFEWVLKKDIFSMDIVLKSRHFSCGVEGQTSWYLQLELCRVPSNDIYVGLYLMPSSKPLDKIHTKSRFGLITKDGKEKNVLCANSVFSDSDGWGKCKFIKLDSLLSEENNFKKGKITIFWDLQVYKNLEVPKSTFGDDLSEMLESSDFSDATLVVRGEELKVHRNVLSSRSPGFRTAFHRNNQSRRLVIEDLSVTGVKGLLRFLYSGEVKDLSEIAEFVLPAAAKYGVERLKALCEQELCDALDVENVTDFLKLAELHTAKQLKAQALAYISVNSAEVVKDPDFWKLGESNQKLFREAVCAQAEREQGQNGEPLAKRIKLSCRRNDFE